eukprot:NODE_4744_length_631_cov_44.427835_g4082_i0.p1 GENE.NODE_4744_length_631_cov_44.427835_g4082_i0~~NODE_4744_length_631_cov_44.427835_g4082_i0.p1  ORF type:complete len:142 (+),score=40.98 NODE_4744_length_631_cov_44.427835_g4082_i0:22-426(+)
MGELEQVREVSLCMGEYFQIKDDMLDVYGTPEEIGKVGTDIQDFKCSWLAVQFRKHASPSQLQLFKEHYGRAEPESVTKVKQLFDEVNMNQRFAECEEHYAQKIDGLITSFAETCPPFHTSLTQLWGLNFKRKL